VTRVARLRAAAFALACAVAVPGLAARLELPNAGGSLKFAVIGDNGTGKAPQYEVAQQLVLARAAFRFDLVLMVGDNIYGSRTPGDYVDKFERPYGPLLSAGVLFQAALGNHDSPDARFYRPFGMNGERYYTFARSGVRFFVLDTNVLDAPQVAWLESALATSAEPWKICVFHHPLYSNAGRHGSNVDLRVLLEPILVRHGVQAVFAGHDHVYERVKPQKGIYHFVVGSSGQLRRGDLEPSALTAAGFDTDRAFLLAEIDGMDLHFQAISRAGDTIDSGAIARGPRITSTSDEP
jgi:hypothetical protein